jgi:hypothetical protein
MSLRMINRKIQEMVRYTSCALYSAPMNHPNLYPPYLWQGGGLGSLPAVIFTRLICGGLAGLNT